MRVPYQSAMDDDFTVMFMHSVIVVPLNTMWVAVLEVVFVFYFDLQCCLLPAFHNQCA